MPIRNLSAEASEAALQLFNLWHSQPRFGQSGWTSEVHRLLEQLAKYGESDALADVAPYLLIGNAETRQLARRVVGALLSKHAPSLQVAICERFTWLSDWDIPGEWPKLKPSAVAGIAGEVGTEGRSAVLALLSFHRNGYVRHEAVCQLSKSSDGSELTYLLIRLNDWVLPIANDARAAVQVRINDAHIENLAQNLPLILHLNRMVRRDHREIVAAIVDLFFDKQNDAYLKCIIRDSPRDVGREVVHLGLGKVGGHRDRVIRYGVASEDPVVRLKCSSHLEFAYDADRLQEVLDYLAADTFMPVRREALRVRSDRFPEKALQIWESALFDRSRAIRELARFSLEERGHRNATSIYRQRLAERPDDFVALEGLVETGDSTDLDRFRQLLHHRLPSRRVAGIRGLSRVAKDSAIPDFASLLQDESPSVIRALRKAVDSYSYKLNADDLISAALNARQQDARRNSVLLLAGLGKWRAIPSLLAVAAEAEAETARFTEQTIEAWFVPPTCNRDFTRPSEKEKSAIRSSLVSVQGKVSKRLVALVEAGLSQN